MRWLVGPRKETPEFGAIREVRRFLWRPWVLPVTNDQDGPRERRWLERAWVEERYGYTQWIAWRWADPPRVHCSIFIGDLAPGESATIDLSTGGVSRP